MTTMDIVEFAVPIVVPALVTMVGWFIVHARTLKATRDHFRIEQRRRFQTSCLTRIATLQMQPNINETVQLELPALLIELQLFGAQSHLDLFKRVFADIGKNQLPGQSAAMAELARSIRDEVRVEQGLVALDGEIPRLTLARAITNQ